MEEFGGDAGFGLQKGKLQIGPHRHWGGARLRVGGCARPVPTAIFMTAEFDSRILCGCYSLEKEDFRGIKPQWK